MFGFELAKYLPSPVTVRASMRAPCYRFRKLIRPLAVRPRARPAQSLAWLRTSWAEQLAQCGKWRSGACNQLLFQRQCVLVAAAFESSSPPGCAPVRPPRSVAGLAVDKLDEAAGAVWEVALGVLQEHGEPVDPHTPQPPPGRHEETLCARRGPRKPTTAVSLRLHMILT